MYTFKPIITTRASDEVVNELKKSILEGHFPTGSFLPPERELMKQLAVSRTTLREAFRKLEEMELCEIIRGRYGGTRVKTPGVEAITNALNLVVQFSGDKLKEIVEARYVIEKEIAALAAEKSTQEDIEMLERCIEGMKASINSPESYMELDMNFHKTLAKASHNFLLEGMLLSLEIYLLEIIKNLSTSTSYRGQGIIQHQQIIDAIKLKKPDLARNAIIRMLAVPTLDTRA